MADIARLFNFVDGTPAVADQVDAELDQLIATINNLDSANLSPTAGITNGQLATGSAGLATGSFSAYRNAALSLANAAVVVFDTEEWDVSNWYDTANGRFTPQVAGYYRLTGRLQVQLASGLDLASEYLQAYVQKNGSVARNGDYQGGNGAVFPVAAQVDALVKANGTTDYFEIAIGHNVGGSIPLTVGASFIRFEGELVGKS